MKCAMISAAALLLFTQAATAVDCNGTMRITNDTQIGGASYPIEIPVRGFQTSAGNQGVASELGNPRKSTWIKGYQQDVTFQVDTPANTPVDYLFKYGVHGPSGLLKKKSTGTILCPNGGTVYVTLN